MPPISSIRLEREASVLPPVEQLGERVLHERQGAGLLGDVGGDLGDEGGLDRLTDRARRPDDRPLELVGCERGHDLGAALPSRSPNRGKMSGRS